MKRTIRWQLVFSFLLFSFLIIGMISWGTIQLMDVYFQDYVEERKETEISEYVKDIEDAYQIGSGFDEKMMNSLHMFAMHSDFSFELYNEEGDLLQSSAQSHDMQGNHSMHGMMNQSTSDELERSYSLKKDGKSIGTAVFRFKESSSYTEDDQQFITKMKQNFLIVGGTAFLFSILFAGSIAQKFSKPLITINHFTKKVSKGGYQDFLEPDTPIVEMNELMENLNELTSQLKRQEKMRSQLSRDLAHEIRTPLTTVKGNLEAMMDGIWAPTPERLETCYIEINRMTRLIGNIERLNEMERESLVIQKTKVNVKDLSNQVVANFEALIKEKQLSIQVNGESVQVQADRDRISQVFTNLLANAIKFTPEKGRISISIEKNKEYIKWTIQDTGKGMSVDELSHIFDRFYMVDPSRNSRLGGQGIGLSIVKSIVHAHQGKITVDSIPEKGTSFTVKLPIE
ncbi:HAMP domain-containing histidine kinase [Jeotgalibaca sp. MA1X17-3]|uniref:sensor histidine kinase n=1 Tax=Jeotgalibaca sp. MA1X17-3 TaxID=2908211 RepID=UPI001F443417|nr:HAMP domain-containing sensor histidine kinase [Jeotgalibaca sp. MA1X17-3]UJF15595.1 HAMP domain-containing histidine kinase [Jeotgalibaca sp. MA1X17-3]